MSIMTTGVHHSHHLANNSQHSLSSRIGKASKSARQPEVVFELGIIVLQAITTTPVSAISSVKEISQELRTDFI